METFFDLVEADKIKTRIMFIQNSIVAKSLRSEQLENEYFLLYYQGSILLTQWVFLFIGGIWENEEEAR